MTDTLTPLVPDECRADEETLSRVLDALLFELNPVCLSAGLLDSCEAVLGEDSRLTPGQAESLALFQLQVLAGLMRYVPCEHPMREAAVNLLREGTPPADDAAALGHLRRLALCVLELATWIALAASPKNLSAGAPRGP
ncbi:hypothetical protein [Streptomyces sp. NRRL F-5123]|uniref:hypothetical protein n=1 Tax=Streptomyces sp. NRRL F-5123 TaxID=1463856 RepID=UPI0004E26207|nr:hypothetical protein [Streptomyces sp. NRRL F-5123]